MNFEYEARLEDIRSGPWREKSLLARRTLPALSRAETHRHLRSHYTDPKGVTGRTEIAFRESFDQALEELQLLELAIECGYLTIDHVRAIAVEEMNTLLATSAARAYVGIYDFVPIRFLAARVGIDLGVPSLEPPAANPKAAVRYATFLALHADFISSEAVRKFTMILDDFRLSQVIDARFFKDRMAGEEVSLTAKQQAQFDRLCFGFIQFVQTLDDLFAQLELEERPLFGCTYGYWLSHFFGLRRTQNGYERGGLSFEDVELSPRIFGPAAEPGIISSEQKRLRKGITVLRATWHDTRSLIESLERV